MCSLIESDVIVVNNGHVSQVSSYEAEKLEVAHLSANSVSANDVNMNE